EGVEELFLGALFLRQELDVVNQEHIHGPEFIAEADHFVVAERVDHLVGKLLARDVTDGGLRRPALDLVADGLHQVSLAHAGAAVEEERVVGFRSALASDATPAPPAAEVNQYSDRRSNYEPRTRRHAGWEYSTDRPRR